MEVEKKESTGKAQPLLTLWTSLYLASILIPLVSSSHMIQSSYKGAWEM